MYIVKYRRALKMSDAHVYTLRSTSGHNTRQLTCKVVCVCQLTYMCVPQPSELTARDGPDYGET